MNESIDKLKSFKLWKHYSGTVYEILVLSNLNATKPGWVPTVTYRSRDNPDSVYSRPIEDFVDAAEPL